MRPDPLFRYLARRDFGERHPQLGRQVLFSLLRAAARQASIFACVSFAGSVQCDISRLKAPLQLLTQS
jgi:hypothetical protein